MAPRNRSQGWLCFDENRYFEALAKATHPERGTLP
jgi:hypothetical protein